MDALERDVKANKPATASWLMFLKRYSARCWTARGIYWSEIYPMGF